MFIATSKFEECNCVNLVLLSLIGPMILLRNIKVIIFLFQFHSKSQKSDLEVGDDYNIPHWMNHRY